MSTASLLPKVLADVSKVENLSTTSTAISKTIGCAICNSWGEASTVKNRSQNWNYSDKKCPVCGNNCGKPSLLDLFCGGGGAARGLQQAGFCVLGIDIKPQPHYAGCRFVQGDALTYPLEGFDAYWASPPCQFYSRLRHLPWLKGKEYWESIPPTRALLESTGKPWIMENVEGAPMQAIVLCGQMFNLPIFRHRQFEASFLLLQPPHEKHNGRLAGGKASMAKRYATGRVGVKEISRESVAGHMAGVDRVRQALGIDWMNQHELAQAIPPAYSRFIGEQLMKVLKGVPCANASSSS
jgi:DNA (cytosine-5)-methyltransferase 1